MWPSGKLRLEPVILSHSGQIPSRSSCILISSFILGTEQLEPQVLLKNFPFRKKPRTVKLSTFDKFTLYNSILFIFFFFPENAGGEEHIGTPPVSGHARLIFFCLAPGTVSDSQGSFGKKYFNKKKCIFLVISRVERFLHACWAFVCLL